MAVNSFKFFVEPLLRVLAENPAGLAVSDAHELTTAKMNLTEAQKDEQTKGGANRSKVFVMFAHDRLKRAEYSQTAGRGRYKITAKGQAFVEGHPTSLSPEELKTLMSFSTTVPLRSNELDEAQPSTDLDDATESPRRIWLISLGRDAVFLDECIRDNVIAVRWNDLGDLRLFESQTAINAALRKLGDGDTNPVMDTLACWEFSREMQVGDLVYVKRGRKHIVAHGTISSDYRFASDRGFKHVRSVTWGGRGEWTAREKPFVSKTLTEISSYATLVRDIFAAIHGETLPAIEPVSVVRAFSIDDAAKSVFMPRHQIEEILDQWQYRKNLILQGPPGVGKSFFAMQLAYLMIGSENPDQIKRVQFHQSYSYEDFVQGLRPNESGGFVRKDGPLLTFCKDALEDQASPYVLIIDEINRGNISKILGELLSLLEVDKREPKYALALAYARDDEPNFYVPPNLHVIGMMNTADRSLAFVDFALRRRFAFLDIAPAFESAEFSKHLLSREIPQTAVDRIVRNFRSLNELIANDPSLGRGYCVGHSYFCSDPSRDFERWYNSIIRYEIEPLLREYWFDNDAKLNEARKLIAR